MSEPSAEVAGNAYYKKAVTLEQPTLSLQGERLTEEDVEAVAEAVKRNGRVSNLDLSIR